MPPSASAEAARIVDTVGEVEEEGVVETNLAVDDLRRGSQPSSNRPRKELGPLGIEDIRSEPPANTVGSDRPRTLNVIEINASETPRSDGLLAHAENARIDPFGEEITTESPVSRLFGDDEDEASVSDDDRELAREYALDDMRPIESEVRVSLQPVRDVLARRDELEFDEQRHSLSSVLGARPSLRPSPQPDKPQRDSASVLWWLVVAALVGIIAAAGAIAAREQFATEQETAPSAEPEAASAPVVEAPQPKAKPVSFGMPQRVEKVEPAQVEPVKAEPVKVEPKPEPAKAASNTPRSPASPSAASAVPAAQSAAVRAGAPYTSAVTGAASAAKPTAATANASAVKPSERKPKPGAARPATEAPENNYAPGYGKSLQGSSYAPGYAVEPKPVEERGKPDLAPAKESRDNELPGLPINPYE